MVLGTHCTTPGLYLPFDRSYTFDGNTWTSVQMPAAWNGRGPSAMAWDPAAGMLMTWGGSSDKEQYTDTWYGDGVTWRKVAG